MALSCNLAGSAHETAAAAATAAGMEAAAAAEATPPVAVAAVAAVEAAAATRHERGHGSSLLGTSHRTAHGERRRGYLIQITP